jgi:hypothetical protein
MSGGFCSETAASQDNPNGSTGPMSRARCREGGNPTPPAAWAKRVKLPNCEGGSFETAVRPHGPHGSRSRAEARRLEASSSSRRRQCIGASFEAASRRLSTRWLGVAEPQKSEAKPLKTNGREQNCTVPPEASRSAQCAFKSSPRRSGLKRITMTIATATTPATSASAKP